MKKNLSNACQYIFLIIEKWLSLEYNKQMKKKVRQEVEAIIKVWHYRDCSVEEFRERCIWQIISREANLSEGFIQEYKHEVNWFDISNCQKMSEHFIRKFKDMVVWKCVSWSQSLSENFMREFEDRIEWSRIPNRLTWPRNSESGVNRQQLSQSFIRDFKDRLNWGYISLTQQDLSESFIFEFRHYLILPTLIERGLTSIERLEELEMEYWKKNLCNRFEMMEL